MPEITIVQEQITTLKIGTRGSDLALWQARHLQQMLREVGVDTELCIIKTRGDQIQHLGFDKMEGKGFFTKEIEDALLNHEVDVAVHSMKDLPTTSPEGLVTAGVSYREDPADWLLIRPEAAVTDAPLSLQKGAVVGTSSARRKAQLSHLMPDVQVRDIRGNVPTRIRKLRHGDVDAILLAAAGLQRLNLALDNLHVVRFHPKEFIPAPAQGVMAFQTRTDDYPTRRIIQQIHRSEVSELTNIERKVLKLLDGGCQLPLGVYCEKDVMGNFHVVAAMAAGWDGPLKRVQLSSSTSHQLAERVVEQLQSDNI